MKNLQIFFKNPFAGRRGGLNQLLAFTTDHLQRLKVNNGGGEWSARLAATEAALAGVSDSYVADNSRLGQRKSSKQMKRAFRAALRGRVSPLHLAVQAKYGERAPEVWSCFPQGRQGLARCADDGLSNRLAALVTALTARTADLGPGPAAAAQALLAEWEPVYAASEAASGAKARTQSEQRAARAVLERELFLNLLALAQAFPGEPAKLAAFMQPSLLAGRGTKRSG